MATGFRFNIHTKQAEEYEFEPVIEPDRPLPALTCSPWQMRKALRRLDLLNTVKQAVAQSADEDMQAGWEYATEFRQDDPFCVAMAQSLGADLTAVFQLAVTL